MQMKIDNIYHNKNGELYFKIDQKKFTGIVGNNSDDLTHISNLLALKYKAQVISFNEFNSTMNGTVYNFIIENNLKYKYNDEELNSKIIDIIKKLDLDNLILNRDLSTLSTSEKIKILLCKVLIEEPDFLILDKILEELDFKSKTKVIKMLIKLNRFYNKTIVITTIDVNNIFEYIDNIIIIYNGEIIVDSNKFMSYKRSDVLNNELIEKPLVIDVAYKIESKKDVVLGNNESINELIKAIYREIR